MHNIVVVSDLHVNSTVGLCSPQADLDDGGSYGLSRTQHWLWRNWLLLRDHIAGLSNMILIFNGDLCEADPKSRSHQIITRNRAVICRLTIKTIEPLTEMPNVLGIYVIRGTEAHTGKSAAMEELVADDLDATIPCPETKTKSWWSLRLEVEGVRMDISHDGGGMSGIPWNRAGAANNLASRSFFTASVNREPAPDIVIRSHVHRWGDSYDAFPVRALITPAWTTKTSYINKIAPNELAEVGAAIIHIGCGHYEVEKWKASLPKRAYTKL